MKLSTRTVGLGVAGLAALAVLVFWPRPPEGPEELVRRQVVRMVEAAEKRDVGDILERVSTRFRSEEGADRDQLRGLLAAQILRGTWVRVFVTDLKVTTESTQQVKVEGTFIFGRSEAKELKDLAKESELGSYRIEARFEQDPDQEWRAVWARHERLSGG